MSDTLYVIVALHLVCAAHGVLFSGCEGFLGGGGLAHTSLLRVGLLLLLFDFDLENVDNGAGRSGFDATAVACILMVAVTA